MSSNRRPSKRSDLAQGREVGNGLSPHLALISHGRYPCGALLFLSLPLLVSLAGLSLPRRWWPWWLMVGGREVWLLLVLDLLVFSSLPANNEAARSGSGGAASPILRSLNLGTEKGIGGSHASTLVPHP